MKEEVVLGWIHEGLLKAIDVRAAGSTRPKWRITPGQLAEFDLARERRSEMPTTPRKKKSVAGVELVDPATGRLKPAFLKVPPPRKMTARS
jgi:hypothetical protein